MLLCSIERKEEEEEEDMSIVAFTLYQLFYSLYYYAIVVFITFLLLLNDDIWTKTAFGKEAPCVVAPCSLVYCTQPSLQPSSIVMLVCTLQPFDVTWPTFLRAVCSFTIFAVTCRLFCGTVDRWCVFAFCTSSVLLFTYSCWFSSSSVPLF